MQIQPIEDILARAPQMSIEQLQAEVWARDAEVQRLRDEMRAIHLQLEPKWIAEMRANSGPSHLAQTMQPGSVSGDLGNEPLASLKAMATRLMDEINRRIGGGGNG